MKCIACAVVEASKENLTSLAAGERIASVFLHGVAVGAKAAGGLIPTPFCEPHAKEMDFFVQALGGETVLVTIPLESKGEPS